MNSYQIVYAPRSDATPNAEISALAMVYRLIADSAKTRGRLTDECGPDDVKGGSESDFHAERRIR
jgi:hypothetical protein